MASIVCDVYDKSGIAMDCKYQGFHYETGNWSAVLNTENQQISFDNEDANWDGNGVAVPSGDVLLIVAWVDGNTRQESHSQFSLLKITSTGESLYTPDVQLMDCKAPTMSLSVPNGTINHTIAASITSSALYQWDFNGSTFYHKNSYYGQYIFDQVSISTTEYDFGDGWVSSNQHTFTVIGDKTVNGRITSNCGLTTEDTKSIEIRYNTPNGTFEETPVPLKLDDTATVELTVTDPDSRVTLIEHYLEDSSKGDSTELVSNYTHLISENKSYPYYSDVFWNDGYNDVKFRLNGVLSLENQAPTIDLVVEGEEPSFTLVSNAEDFEGELDRVIFRIYIDGNKIVEDGSTVEAWSLVSTKTVYSGDWNQAVTFYSSGSFKITCQAYDTPGKSSSIEEAFIAVGTAASGTTGTETYYIEWE